MKLENIGRAHELLARREMLFDTVEKLENEDVYLCDERGDTIDLLNGNMARKLAEMYNELITTVEKEIESL